DPAHGHPQVFGLDDDDDSLGVEMLDDRVGDLRGQALLDLGAARVDLDEPREFRQTGDLALAARDVADVGDAVEGHQMVFARARPPRLVIHRCSASTTTMTPWGSRCSTIASAICEVRRSWTWGRRA